MTEQIKYLLQEAKISLAAEVVAKLYIEKVAERGEVMEILSSEEGILDETLFFPLTLSAQLTAQAERLKKWAIKSLRVTDRNAPYFAYLSACTTYLVRDFFGSKCEELEQLLLRGGLNEPIFKKLSVLLSERAL